MRRKDKRNLLLVHSELMDGKFKVGRSAFTLQSCKIYFICETTSSWGGGLMLRKDEFYVYCKIVHWYNYLIITDNKITHWDNTEKKLECWFMSAWYSDLNLNLGWKLRLEAYLCWKLRFWNADLCWKLCFWL